LKKSGKRGQLKEKIESELKVISREMEKGQLQKSGKNGKKKNKKNSEKNKKILFN